MIIKILTRRTPSYRSLIQYILNEEKNHDPLIVTNNLRSDNGIDGYVKEFIENEALRKYPRSNSIRLYHEIVSMNADEHISGITNEMLSDLMRTYINLRGNTSMSIGAVHWDSEHQVHFHICSSGLEYRTGKAFRLSKEQLHTLQVSFQEYHREKYPMLSESFCEFGKGHDHVTNKGWYARHKETRAKMKTEVSNKVQAIYAQSLSQSDFLDKLRNEGLHFYERGNNGKATGIEHNNMKFRFSKLGIDINQLNAYNKDEKKALADIQSLRAKSKTYERDKNAIEHDTDMEIE